MYVARIMRGETTAYAIILTAITQIFVVILNLLTGVITARYLGPEGRGIFVTVTVIPQFLSGIAGSGVASAVVYFSRQNPNEKTTILYSGLTITGTVCACITIIGFFTVPYAMQSFSHSIIVQSEFLMLFIWCGPFINVLRLRMAAFGYYQLVNLSSWSSPLMYLIGLLIVLLSDTLNVWTSIICLALPGPFLVVWMFILCRGGRLNFGNKKWMSSITAYSVRAAPLDVIGSISGFIDRFFLLGIVTPEELGVYAVVFNLSRVIFVLHAVINLVVYPSMNGRSSKDMKEIHDQVLRLITYLVGIGVLLTHFIGPTVVRLVYGSAYAEPRVRLLLEVLVLDAGIKTMSQVIVQLYLASGKPSFASIVQTTGLCVECISLALLIPELGVSGAAYGLLAASFARLFLLLAGVVFVLKSSLPRLYPKYNDLLYVHRMLR